VRARRAQQALELEIAMGFKTILVPIEQHDLMNSTLETALLLARKFDSYIEGFALRVAIPAAFAAGFAVNLNPTIARKPATMRATQLTHLGTDQSPMMTGQSAKIRTRWNSATKVKIIPATRKYAGRP